MTLKYLQFKNFNKRHQNNRYFLTLSENTYMFKVEWNKYCQCAFLSIYDDNNNPIISGRALTNRLYIRHNELPHNFFFFQQNGKTYEPTINNIESEFILSYDDEVDEE